MAETVRIDPVSHATLVELARAKHIPISEVLARAVSAYRHEQMFQALDAGYGELQSDPQAWAEELAERGQWDSSAECERADE